MSDQPESLLTPDELAQWEADRRVFCTKPQWKDMDDEEALADCRRRVAILRRWRRQFAAIKIDAEAMALELEAAEADFAKAAVKAEAAIDKSLHAAADVAEARHAVFKALAAAIGPLYELKPFDPQVQELKEQLDEWRKEFPKE